MSRQRFKNKSEPKIPMLVLRMNEPEKHSRLRYLRRKALSFAICLTHSMYFTYTSHRQLHLNFNLVNGIFLFC